MTPSGLATGRRVQLGITDCNACGLDVRSWREPGRSLIDVRRPHESRRGCALAQGRQFSVSFLGEPKAMNTDAHNRRRGAAMPCFQAPRSLNLFRRLLGDESGGEVLEYALVAGLIIVGAIGLIGKVGVKVLARWSSLNSSL